MYTTHPGVGGGINMTPRTTECDIYKICNLCTNNLLSFILHLAQS